MFESPLDAPTLTRLQALCNILRDDFGIVNPLGHILVVTLPAGTLIACINPWPVGVDKREADRRIKAKGFVLYPSVIEPNPYGSAYYLTQ